MKVLLVEDSWQVGRAMMKLLHSLGMDAAGPAASSAEAGILISERVPDVAVIDFNLRGGEQALGLIDQLNDRGTCVIVTSGFEDPPLPEGKAIAILQKPISMEKLLAALHLVAAQKAGS